MKTLLTTICVLGLLASAGGVEAARVSDRVGNVQPNYSLAFDGVDDYVDLGTELSITGTTPFTFAAWINPTELAQYDGVFSNSEGGGGSTIKISWGIGNANDMALYLGNGTTNVVSTSNDNSLQAGRWQHIAVSRAADGTVTHYVNGVARGVADIDSVVAAGISWKIGRDFNSASYSFTGKIDDVLAFNSVLTQPQIQAIYQTGTIPTATRAYRFNTPSSTVVDSSTNADIGTTYGAIYSPNVPRQFASRTLSRSGRRN